MARTRVVLTGPENGYGQGRWLAQYHDASMGVWFDIGDPHDTEAGALRAAAAWSDRRAVADAERANRQWELGLL